MTSVDNRTGNREDWELAEWLPFIQRGVLDNIRLPKRKTDFRDRIFNMNGIEISGTDLEHRTTTPFLQREMDPSVRFEKELESDNAPRAALYCMSSKAGSLTVSNAS